VGGVAYDLLKLVAELIVLWMSITFLIKWHKLCRAGPQGSGLLLSGRVQPMTAGQSSESKAGSLMCLIIPILDYRAPCWPAFRESLRLKQDWAHLLTPSLPRRDYSESV
jgi:hypothetical protein